MTCPRRDDGVARGLGHDVIRIPSEADVPPAEDAPPPGWDEGDDLPLLDELFDDDDDTGGSDTP